jgi:PAS domain S-box-containing protein
MKDAEKTKAQLIKELAELRQKVTQLEAAETERKRVEEVLWKSEALLNSLIEQSPYAMWISDEKGTLIRINPACCDLLHITEQDVVDKYNVLKDNIVVEQGRLPLVQRVFEQGEAVRFELTYDSSQLKHLQLPKTVLVILDTTIFPIKDAQGIVTNAVIQHIDITARKRVEQEITARKRAEEEIQKLNAQLQRVLAERTTQLTQEIVEHRQAEHALQDSEDRFRAAQDISLEAFTILRSIRDEQGQIRDFEWTYANPAAGRILKQPPEKLIGQRLLEVLPGNQENLALFDRYVRIVETGQGDKVELEYQSEGISGWFRNMTVKLGDGVAVSFSDITDRKQAEESLRKSEERFRTSVENMLDCFGIYSAVRDHAGHIVDFRVEYVNEAACKNNLMTREEQLGKYLCELLPAHRTTGLFEEYCQVVETGESLTKESLIYEDVYNRQHLIRIRAFDIRAVKLGDGFAAAWRDITDRKWAEKALQESERQQQELNASKDKFFAILAHDLKNPLISFMSFARLLEQGIEDGEIDQIKKLAGQFHDSTKNLFALLENLLLWSQIQRGMIEPSPQEVPLGAFVVRNIKLLTPNAAQKQIRLNNLVQDEISVFGDINMVDSVVRNLLSNAIKFTKAGGAVAISATYDEQTATVMVSDTGIGIPPEKLTDLFRIDAKCQREGTAGEKGTGLGLILCKEFVEKNDGRIWVESEVGKGTTFSFTLPKKPMEL